MNWLRWLGFLGMTCYFCQSIKPVSAEIVGDRTLPESTRVTSQGNRVEITGGTRAGNHLFHSFERFSIPTGGAAVFDHDTAVTNIFSRVTGRSISRIDGELRANGNANLFLLNPNGIVFGPNAVLNIGGSFVGSTANRLRFADGSEYSTVNPAVPPLLTVSAPVGLQFASRSESSNSAVRSGQIQVLGNGNNLFLNAPDNPSVNRSDRPVGLQVNPGRTLALVGRNLILQGGNLTAAAGRIELGSVASGQVNLAALQSSESGWRLNYDAVPAFGDIRLTDAASLEVSGDRGGIIRLQGRAIQIGGASALLADTLGTGTGGALTVQASERVQLSGFTVLPTGPFVSRLSTDVAVGATGQGGRLTVATPILQIDNGGQISSGTFGAGNAGILRVQTETLQIAGGSIVGPSGLFVPVAATATGNGGRLWLTTDRLELVDRAQIAATTFGAGNAGTIDIQASQVDLRSGGGIFAIVESGAIGSGSRLTLVVDRLRVTDGSQIATLTAGEGRAGDMNITARGIELTGGTAQFPSSLLASVEPDAIGAGGSIVITTDRLRILAGGEISTTTFGSGSAGNLLVTAEDITVNGGSPSGPSALFATSRSSGAGGRLTLNTNRLRVEAGGQIATSTSGSGNAGNLSIDASSIELVGGNRFAQSGLLSSAIVDTGTGGNLRINTDRLVIEDGATISASNFPTTQNILAGQGGVGDLRLNANLIVLNNQAQLTTDSAAGDRGNITLRSGNTILLQGSRITTNARGTARGGNIDLTSGLLAAATNSDITANAISNFGGRVTIQSEAVLGTQIRSQLTAQSDITAFSELGARFSGTVQLDAPIVDPSRGLVQLPEVPIDASNQIAAACAAREGSEFVITGRGGLPEAPVQVLRGSTFWEDLRTSHSENQVTIPDDSEHVTRNIAANTGNEDGKPPVEAQGWQVNEAGQVVLVAQVSPSLAPLSATPHIAPVLINPVSINCAAVGSVSDS